MEDARAPSLKLGDRAKVAVGDTVFAVGNPQGLEGTFSQGIVSDIRQFETDSLDSLLQITAPISPGSSGSPVLDSEGKVIGVAVATFKSGQNLNFAIPAEYVLELLRNLGKPEPLSSKPSMMAKPVLGELGGGKRGPDRHRDCREELYIRHTWDCWDFSFSLINQLREPVKNIVCLLAFFDLDGNPIDVSSVNYSGAIPAGLAKRINGRVDPSVEKLCVGRTLEPYPRKPKGRIEFQILDFEITE